MVPASTPRAGPRAPPQDDSSGPEACEHPVGLGRDDRRVARGAGGLWIQQCVTDSQVGAHDKTNLHIEQAGCIWVLGKSYLGLP